MKTTDNRLKSQIVDLKKSMVLKEDGSVHLIVKVPQTAISSKDMVGKRKFKDKQLGVFEELEKYTNFEILELTLGIDLAKHYRDLSKSYYPPLKDFANYLAEETSEELLAELGRVYEHFSFISIPLKTNRLRLDIKTAKKQAQEIVSKEVASLFNREVGFDSNWYEEFETDSKNILSSLMPLGAELLSDEELGFVLVSRYMRGLVVDETSVKAHLDNTLEAIDDSKVFFLKEGLMAFATRGRFGYAKSLPIIADPTVMNNADIQTFFHSFNFEISTTCRAEFVSNRGMNSPKEKGRKAAKRGKNATDEASEAGSRQSKQSLETQELAEHQESDIEKGKKFLEFTYSIEIYGTTPEEVWEKEDIIMSSLKGTGLEISSGTADQYSEFLCSRFTEGHKTKPTYFVQTQPLETFVEHLWFTSNKVGNTEGFYIARVVDRLESYRGDFERAIQDSNKLVFFNMYLGNKLGIKGKMTANGHILIVGETGSGKSYLTKLLFLCHSLLRSQTLYIDPKAEMRAQYLAVLEDYESRGVYPEICDYIRQMNFVTLRADDKNNHGILDPLVFAPAEACADLASSMLMELLGKEVLQNHPAFETMFNRTLNKYIRKRDEEGQKVGLLHIFDEMVKSDEKEIKDLADLVLSRVENSVLRLAFSHGENEGLNLKNHMTIVEVWGMDLPQDGSNDLTLSQRKSLVLMYALAYFCRAFGERSKDETSVFIDEAWFLTTSSVGKSVLKEMRRAGRSYNNFLVMISQSLKDSYSDDDMTGFGQVFVFNQPTESAENLRYLKVPVNDTTLHWIENMTMGECLFKDSFNRVERIVIDGMHPEVTKLFDTLPEGEKEVA